MPRVALGGRGQVVAATRCQLVAALVRSAKATQVVEGGGGDALPACCGARAQRDSGKRGWGGGVAVLAAVAAKSFMLLAHT